MTCTAHSAIANLPRPMVSVNGIVITHDEISRETQHHPARTPIEAWTQAARALVLRELLLRRARELGIEPEPETDGDGRRETDEEALIRTVIEHDVRVPEADEATCRRFYERNPTRFRSPDIFEAAHILIAARQEDAEAFTAARQRASELHAAIAAGQADFCDVARRCSDCSSGLNGGLLGQITSGDTTPEFEAALQQLEPGDMSPAPVGTRYGFHIVRLDRRIASSIVPFESVRDQLAADLEERVQRKAMAQYDGVLLGAAEIRGIELSDVGSALVQ